MMSSNNKRGVMMMRTLLTSNYGGCGGCRKPKPSQVHQPTPKPNHNHTTATTTTNPSLTSSTTSTGDRDDDEDKLTSTTVSESDTHHHQDHNNNKGSTAKNNNNNNNNASLLVRGSTKMVDDSVAVEKESKDPYRDFRYSMLQMIFEKKIFSESGLQELLQCFLELNAPCHHHVIVQVFMEVCQQTFPKKFCGSGDDGGDGGGEPHHLARR